MTENEKVKKWFKTELSMRIEESLDAIDCEDVMDICIKALEEIQQYREIGLTPKMVKEMIESEKLASHQAIIRGAKLEQYEAIGTIEEFKVLKNTDIPIIHGKAELDLNDNEVRNKAIDEFVIKLKRVRGYGLITNFDRPFGVTFNKLDEIAEEMKGGAE